jgi:site-specific DNA-methyltransferase (adenine-specific)
MMLNNNYNPDVLTCLANLSNDEVFTPPQVVNRMLDLLPQELFRSKTTRFLDPVSKSGVFLREIAKRLMAGLATEIPDIYERADHIFTQQLFGIAITELTALTSRRSVYCSKKANGPYSVCRKFQNEEGNLRFRAIEHTFVDGKCKYCGASESVFGKAKRTDLESHAYEFIHTDKPEKLFGNMKFDVIIGNPPYQLNIGVQKENYAIPIYHRFFQQAKKLYPRYITMIIPSRWFTGGRGLDEFRSEMLNDSRIKYIKDYIDSKDVFPGVDVSGGVNFFLWAKDYDGPCEYINVVNGTETRALRKLNEYSVFPRYNQTTSLINKAKQFNENNISPMISSQTPFGFITTYRGQDSCFDDALSLYSSGGISYVKREDVSRHSEWIDKFKVIFSKATCEHAGTPDKSGRYRVFSTMRILSPQEICTQSYLVGGVFETRLEAENYLSYLRTAFVRILMLPTLTSQDISADKFQFVPLQDFSHPWTDAMLYEKYGLTDDEIAFIESMIRPME